LLGAVGDTELPLKSHFEFPGSASISFSTPDFENYGEFRGKCSCELRVEAQLKLFSRPQIDHIMYYSLEILMEHPGGTPPFFLDKMTKLKHNQQHK
jgi:hypothetical protein